MLRSEKPIASSVTSLFDAGSRASGLFGLFDAFFRECANFRRDVETRITFLRHDGTAGLNHYLGGWVLRQRQGWTARIKVITA